MIVDKKHAPFGSKVQRFCGLGYHPGLETRTGTYNYSNIYPGCYETKKERRIVSKVPRWKRQMEMEEFSRRMGYTGDHLLEKIKWFQSINGPGWNDLPPCGLDRGITFSKAPRFPISKAYAVPGPGTYGKNHVPHSTVEEKDRSKGFSFSTLPSFEQTSNVPRSLSSEKPYHLPPNLYTIKSSIDALVSKRVSKRGPYDLFTGNRFPDPVVWKFSTLAHKIHPSDRNHPKNAFKGEFLKCGKDAQITSRLALISLAAAKKDPLDPGPNYYDPYPPPPIVQANAPFNSSVRNARPVVKCELSPPPGRYNLDVKRRITGDGMRSVFLSKKPRCLPQPQKHSWFE